jgi:modulator of FtsH protease
LASIAGIFLSIPILPVLVSCAFVLVSSGLILFQTSQIIHGGERNYIMATISLYVSLFNLFVSLLNILSFFGGGRKN